MKAASETLTSILMSSSQYQMADIYTFTLANGAVLRLTDAAADLIVDYVYTYSGTTLRIERSQIRTTIGVEVDELTVTLYPAATDTLGSTEFFAGLLAGQMDGARLRLERAFMPLLTAGGVPSWGNTTAGTVAMFEGRVGDITATRTSAVLKVRSDLELLNIQMPRNLYQPGCNRTLYDSGCTVNQAAYANYGILLAGSTAQTFVTVLSQPPGYFNQGYITMTGGDAYGQQASIANWGSGVLSLVMPLTTAPAAGDPFVAYPGCDKTLATCQNVFNNVAHFRGFPYIPPVETAL